MIPIDVTPHRKFIAIGGKTTIDFPIGDHYNVSLYRTYPNVLIPQTYLHVYTLT